jgi:hypothetical protein
MERKNASSPVRAGTSRLPRLTRQEWTLVVLGLAVWVALAIGGAWLVHQFTRAKASCGGQVEARTAQPRGQAQGPRNALQLLTGTGRCQ